MNCQRQSCNGSTIESIDVRHYVNGVEVSISKLERIYAI